MAEILNQTFLNQTFQTFTFPFGWLPIFQKKIPQASKLTILVYKTPVYFTKIPPLEDVLCTLSALET